MELPFVQEIIIYRLIIKKEKILIIGLLTMRYDIMSNKIIKRKRGVKRYTLSRFDNQDYWLNNSVYKFIKSVNNFFNIKECVVCSSLCVAPETKTLTDQGYLRMSVLNNKEVNVWSGQKFTKTVVRKTSDRTKLLKIITDSGYWLYCTLYHKFNIYEHDDSKEVREVRAMDLKPGMNLVDFDLPVIEGDKDMLDPYINGFYTGDGCLTFCGQKVYLTGENKKLASIFTGGSEWSKDDENDRISKHYKHLHIKFFVPDSTYTIKSRLDWLAGFADADGCIYRTESNQQLILSSVDNNFLEKITLMLQTLGVMSKIKPENRESEKLSTVRIDNTDSKLYNCKAKYRLIIANNNLQRLLDLGIEFKRLVVERNHLRRNGKRFIQISSVVDDGRYDETYSFTEVERGMGMFNGILIGN